MKCETKLTQQMSAARNGVTTLRCESNDCHVLKRAQPSKRQLQANHTGISTV